MSSVLVGKRYIYYFNWFFLLSVTSIIISLHLFGITLKGAETNLYTFRFWLVYKRLQICFRSLYLFNDNKIQYFGICLDIQFTELRLIQKIIISSTPHPNQIVALLSKLLVISWFLGNNNRIIRFPFRCCI